MRTRALLLLLPLWASAGQAERATQPDPRSGEDLPSLELLEYLAEYAEDEDGNLLDPMDQADQAEESGPRSYSYRQYMQEQMKR